MTNEDAEFNVSDVTSAYPASAENYENATGVPLYFQTLYFNSTPSFVWNLSDEDTWLLAGFHRSIAHSFFDTYYSRERFIVETVFAFVFAVFNVFALLLVLQIKGFSPYHVLFVNLVATNALSCLFSWLSNNCLYLFEGAFTELLLKEMNLCKFYVYLSGGWFASTAFGIVTLLTVLGFLTVQYLAICRPLHHTLLIRKRKVVVFILSTWGVTLAICCLPFCSLLGVSYTHVCDLPLLNNILQVVITGANISMAIVSLIYIVAVVMCARIFSAIRMFQHRLSFFRHNLDQNVQRRNFYTSVILLLTMTVFFLPYTILFVVTLNKDDTTEIHSLTLIYYMNLLPYFKYLADPIVYGLRMNEVREVFLHSLQQSVLFRKCTCSTCVHTEPPTLTRRSTTVSLRPIRSFSTST